MLGGCTAPELYVLAGAGVLVWAPLSLTVMGSAGQWLGAPALAALLVFLTVYWGAAALRRAKRGRPEHYFHHLGVLWAARWGLRREVFIRRSGYWSLGRNPRVPLS